jgi:hypothetical protein
MVMDMKDRAGSPLIAEEQRDRAGGRIGMGATFSVGQSA